MTTILIAALSFVVGAITGGFVLPAYQRQRIERRRALIAPDLVEALRVLGQAEQALALMEDHHAAAQDRPAAASVNEHRLGGEPAFTASFPADRFSPKHERDRTA